MRVQAEPAVVFSMRWPLSQRNAIRQAAAKAGESFGGYVRRAAIERLRSEAEQQPAEGTQGCLAA